MFAERFANYRDELSMFRKHQFDGSYSPTYFYDTVLKEMLEGYNLDFNNGNLTSSEFLLCILLL